MTNKNIKRFGKLKDDGDTGDGKATFIVDDQTGEGADSWKRLAIEIETDDCDSKHAKEFKAALIRLWNSQDEPVNALQEAFEEIYDQYDGAPDSTTRYLGSLLETLRSAITSATGKAP